MGLPKTKTQIFTLIIFLFFQGFPVALTFPGLPDINPPQLEIPLPTPNSQQPEIGIGIGIGIGIPLLTPSSQQPENPPQNPSSQEPENPPQNPSSQQPEDPSQNPDSQQPENPPPTPDSQQLENPPENPDSQQSQPENPPQPPLQSEDKEFLDAHNKARAHLGEQLFVWDEKLATYARSWAKQRISDCKMIHSYGPYGENIFWGGRDHWTPKDAVKAWVKEHKFYDRKTNACLPGKLCGHYTQIVWRDSVRVGCARVKCSNGGIFIMCNYDPPGNYVNENPFLPNSVQS
ncbi:hypothetical protein DITRI_Ditri11bG0140700 [Diplodiscus trichospermus]